MSTPGVCPLPSHWLRPWCKFGGKRVLLGMHIYKIYTKHNGHSRPTERKNMKNAYRGGRTLKTPPPPHTHVFPRPPGNFHNPRYNHNWSDCVILLIKQYPAVNMPIIMDEDDRPSWLTQQWNMTCLLPIIAAHSRRELPERLYPYTLRRPQQRYLNGPWFKHSFVLNGLSYGTARLFDSFVLRRSKNEGTSFIISHQ